MFSRFGRCLKQGWERREGSEYDGMAGEKLGKTDPAGCPASLLLTLIWLRGRLAQTEKGNCIS